MNKEAFHLGNANTFIEIGVSWEDIAVMLVLASLAYVGYRLWRKHSHDGM